MVCSNCGTENRDGRRFCIECGLPLQLTCATCGAVLDPAAKFCGECGSPTTGALATGGQTSAGGARAGVQTAQAAPSAASTRSAGSLATSAAPVAERRLVSVLFADLVGFTPFAEERDAEDVRDTLTRYFDIASDVINSYGGTVEKFIGDAVMAVWGAPVAQEDDAERAVRAALELVEGVRVLGPTIQARAGVLTGEAAVTLGATNQGMVAGDLVNTAARLQSVAPAGAVLVGEATHRAASSAIVFEVAGDQMLKGKPAPVPAWRALRVVAQRGGQGRSDLPEPPFVGRDEELRLLREALNATGRERRTRIVSITGPGGIGKSRLAWELEKYIDGVMEPIYWHRGRSPAYGDGITFWALGEMVRRRAGLAETDDEATTRERLDATVAEYVTDPADRAWVGPALLTLLGLEPAPPGGRDVLFAAWRIFFERIAARGTVVLLFEDLQWADSGLLDFIDHLIEWSKGVPILIVTLARPELFDRRPEWGAARRSFTAVALEPLSDMAMRELLSGFVPGLPAAAVEAILERADGIPLYAVETVRALVSDGKLALHDGAYRPTGELGELAIPETLRSLIASRLDALDPGDRALVQDASVLGQTVTVAGLAAVSGRSDEDLEARLRALVRRELFELEADPRSPERGQYRFVQSLIREVAYGTLARPERRQRHLAVARYFEVLGEDELAGALATHYLAAHAASAEGAEADAIAIQARLALRAAGERAATLGSNDQAVSYFSQALAVTNDPADRADLELRAGTCAAEAGDYDAGEAFGRAAVEDYGNAGDAAAAARATAELGSILLHATRLGPALTVLEQALRELPDDSPEDVRARLLVNLSRTYMRTHRYAEALEHADRALVIAEPLRLDEVIANALNNKASVLADSGRNREATALIEAAIDIANDGGFVAAELRARSNMSSMTWDESPRRSYDTQRANLELARRVGNRSMALWIGAQAVAGAWQSGDDWDWALATADEALGLVLAPSDECHVLSTKCLILCSRGEPTDDPLARMEAAAAATREPEHLADVHDLQGDRAFYAGDHRTAHAEFTKAADVFPSLASIYLAQAMRAALWLGDVDLARATVERMDAQPDAAGRLPRTNRIAGRAGIAALEGRNDESLAGFREVWQELRAMEIDYFAALSVLDAVTLLGPLTADLRAAAADARTTFERVGARPCLALLEAALARSPAKEPRAATEAATEAATLRPELGSQR